MLASIGLYGVVSYAVAQRTREMGIRVALGAEPASVVRLLAFDGLRLVLVGGVLGMAAALGVMQLLSGLLFGGRAFDPVTLVVVPLILARAPRSPPTSPPGACDASIRCWRCEQTSYPRGFAPRTPLHALCALLATSADL